MKIFERLLMSKRNQIGMGFTEVDIYAAHLLKAHRAGHLIEVCKHIIQAAVPQILQAHTYSSFIHGILLEVAVPVHCADRRRRESALPSPP